MGGGGWSGVKVTLREYPRELDGPEREGVWKLVGRRVVSSESSEISKLWFLLFFSDIETSFETLVFLCGLFSISSETSRSTIECCTIPCFLNISCIFDLYSC